MRKLWTFQIKQIKTAAQTAGSFSAPVLEAQLRSEGNLYVVMASVVDVDLVACFQSKPIGPAKALNPPPG
jgi:hypothetical protein